MEIDIAGSYPIIINGVTDGEITVSRDGLFWCFDAKSGIRDEIVRLSVYGGGQEGYLGVMEPFGDMLVLRKKLSRSAMNAFPQVITHGGQKNEPATAPEEIHESAPEPPQEAPPDPVPEAVSSPHFPLPYEYDNFGINNVPPENEKPPPSTYNSPQSVQSKYIWRPCAIPCSLFSGIAEKQLCSYIRSALLSNEGDSLLLAVPENIALDIPYNNAIHFIDTVFVSGNKYLVCKIIDGRSVSEL